MLYVPGTCNGRESQCCHIESGFTCLLWIMPDDAGHVCLNLNFLANFPIGLHVILQIQIKKFKNA